MSLHLILGGPGDRNSERLRVKLIESARKNPGRRHVILVPAQFTLQTQRDIVAAHPNHAVMNIDILSFERLTDRVMERAGKRFDILDDMGKNMLLRRAAGEHAEELSLYRRSLHKPGFISRLMSMISEFYQYGVSEEDLALMEKKVADHPLLARKLKELGIFYAALNRTRGKEEITLEERLEWCRRELEHSDFLEGAVVALDYFTGFIPVQRKILQRILSQAEEVMAAFLLPEEEDEEELREGDLFHMSRTAVMQLSGMAEEQGIRVVRHFPAAKEKEDGEALPPASGELRFLSRHFLRTSPRRESWDRENKAVSLLRASTPQEEARMAAAAIARMVREDHFRYREIAVVAGDLEEYRIPLTEEFSRAQIPWFCDRRQGVLGNPLVEYVRSALDIPEKDFSYESVFRFLRTGLTRLAAEEIDRLDLYVSAAGIRGRHRWEENWTRRPASGKNWDLEEMNRSREAVLSVLAPLLEGRAKTVKERTDALRRLLEETEAEKQMTERADLCRARGDLERASEFEKICRCLQELMDQMDRLLGSQAMNRQEFSDILDAGLEAARLGFLPQSLDTVQIGDVRRSRLTEVKALLVLGMNEGRIPAPASEGGILTERERTLLADYELELAPAAEITSGEERFYLYRLLTRPSEKLLLSYSLRNRDGSQARPSYFLAQLHRLFPKLKELEAERLPVRERVSGTESLWQVFAETVREQADSAEGFREGDYGELVRALAEEEGRERFMKLVRASFRTYGEESIGAGAAASLYGKELTGSVTRMEAYAACAARQFFAYGLRLQERKRFEITAAGRGSFFHQILEIFFELLKKEKLKPSGLSEEKRKELTESALRQAASAEESIRIFEESASGQYLYGRWEKLAEKAIALLCDQLSGGDFLPEAFELTFSGWQSPALRIELPEGARVILDGKIDRLDILEEDGRKYLRIVDYKTGAKKFDLNEIWQGLSLQLAIYLDAVLEMQKRKNPEQEILPAGMFYQIVEENVLDAGEASTREAARKNRLKAFRPSGLSSSLPAVEAHQEDVGGSKATTKQMEALMRRAEKMMAEYGEQILKGRVTAAPVRQGTRKACDFCPYAAVCRFDPKVEGYRYRRVPQMSAKQILETIDRENGD